MNPGRRGGKPATNRLSYGAAKTNIFSQGSAGFKATIDLKKCIKVMSLFA
jgi:hypothetical protein